MNILTWLATVASWVGVVFMVFFWIYTSASWALLRTASGASLEKTACIRVVTTPPPAVKQQCRLVSQIGVGESMVVSGAWLGIGADKRAYVRTDGCAYEKGTTFGPDQDPGFLLTRRVDGWHLKCIGGAVEMDSARNTYAQEPLGNYIHEYSAKGSNL